MPEVKLRKSEPIERAIRQLRKKMDKENVMDEYKSRQVRSLTSGARRRAAGLIR